MVWDRRYEETIRKENVRSGSFHEKVDNSQKRKGTTLLMDLSHPRSRGTIRPRSTDPTDAPLIDPKYFSNSKDMRDIILGIRKVQKILKAPSMRHLGAKLIARDPGFFNQASADKCFITTKLDTDKYWECVLRQQANVGLHAVRSCPIGSPNDRYAVVDPNLRVIGVQGLRVADASVMPEISSGNTQGPSIMIGEKAADLIKKDYLIRKY